MQQWVLALAVVLGCAIAAEAAPVIELEANGTASNNSQATAQAIPPSAFTPARAAYGVRSSGIPPGSRRVCRAAVTIRSTTGTSIVRSRSFTPSCTLSGRHRSRRASGCGRLRAPPLASRACRRIAQADLLAHPEDLLIADR
jgi:hypothetical protein